MKYLSSILLAASAMYASTMASPLITRDGGIDGGLLGGLDGGVSPLSSLGLIKDSFWYDKDCRPFLGDRKFDVDVKLLIIVIADIDRKKDHRRDGLEYHDGKECDERREKEIKVRCEAKKRWDRDCDDWKKEHRCEKKEHFHFELECEVEVEKGRGRKEIDGRRKKIELECEAKKKWDHDCERFKKEGRCDDEKHFHFVVECEVEKKGRDGKYLHDGKDCDFDGHRREKEIKIKAECEAKRRWDRDCDDFRRHGKCDKKEHFHFEVECEVEVKKDGKDRYWRK